MSYVCDICETQITHYQNILKHKRTEKCQYIKELLDKRDKLNEEKNNIIKKENEKIKLEIENLKLENIKLKDDNKENETKIKILQDKNEDLRKIVEKAAIKSTTTVKKTYNHNNYLNYISSEPIKFNDIPKQLKNAVTQKSIMFDENEFHDHIVDNLLKDKDGKDKILCTDINRKNFSYKDEISGELISDPELERLREQIKKATEGELHNEIKILKHNLLNKLIKNYEGTKIDPYIKFIEISYRSD